MVIGIIGGKGKFGEWLEKFFSNLGYQLIISDIDSELSNREVVEQADVVIFSVPISETVEIIESVAPYSREGTLWMDMTSVKTDPVKAMLKSKATVIGAHFMFRPTVDLNGQIVVLCPSSDNDWLGWLEGILENNGAKVKIMPPEEHDKIMSVVQILTHLPCIAAGLAFEMMGLDLEKSLEVASPIYRMRIAMIGRVLDGNPELYADIALSNPLAAEATSKLLLAFHQLLCAVTSQDKESFVELFQKAVQFFGSEFTAAASQETDFLIKQMVELDRQKK